MSWLISQRYDVFQCDVDVVWLRNPMPVFESEQLCSTHLLVQRDMVYGLNAGVFLVPASNFTTILMERWIDDMVGPNATHVRKKKEMHGQHSFAYAVKQLPHRFDPPMPHKQLNQSQFPVGKLWMYYAARTNKDTAYMVISIGSRRPRSFIFVATTPGF
eukprot:342527-Prymnesium_polylepis.1